MINQEFKNNVRQDIAKVKKDLGTLEETGAAQLSRLETNVSKAKDDLSTWVGGGISHLGEGFEKLTDDAKGAVASYAAEVNKDVGHGLSRYNSKIQEIADKFPGSFSYKVDRYPWVAISITLVIGFVLGILIKPSRRPLA